MPALSRTRIEVEDCAPHESSPAPVPAYRLSVRVLYADRSGVAFATLALIAAYGYKRGGTTLSAVRIAAILSSASDVDVSEFTVMRALRKLVELGAIVERRIGRKTLRRMVPAIEFVLVSRLVVQSLIESTFSAAGFQFYGHVVRKLAENGKGAGCAFTRDEHAKTLRVRPDSIAPLVDEAVALGFMRVETRSGAGKILVPLHTMPVRRQIDSRARFEIARRRAEWRLPRGGYPQAAKPKTRAALPPLSFAQLPPLSFAQLPRAATASFPQLRQLERPTPLERKVLNDAPPPWDVPGAVWRPSPPPSSWRDERRDVVSCPEHLRPKLFGDRAAPIGSGGRRRAAG